MPIAPTLLRYLDQNTTYEMLLHEPTVSSMRTAEACHISGDCLAKGVVLAPRRLLYARRTAGLATASICSS